MYPFAIRASKFDDFHDAYWDIRLGVDTHGWIENQDLGFADRERQSHATKYHGYRYRRIERLYRESRRFVPDPEVAIDVGCGEGRLVYAFAARGVPGIGVELSAGLVERARRNAARFKGAPVKFEHADAAEYRLPERRAIVLMFNPFDGVVMAKFVENNLATLRRTGSIIAYANDVHAPVLESGGLKRVHRDNVYGHDSLSFSIWRP
jgi:SAM-dependent methyltransferase